MAKNLGDFVINTKENAGYYIARYEASNGTFSKVKSQPNKVVWKDIAQPTAATKSRNMYGGNYVESDLSNSYSWDTAIVFIQNYSGSTNYANKASVNSSVLRETGKAEDKVCNIHDMASNAREWTTESSTEKNSSWTSPCTMRGGTAKGPSHTTALRFSGSTVANDDHTSFRPIMYLKSLN